MQPMIEGIVRIKYYTHRSAKSAFQKLKGHTRRYADLKVVMLSAKESRIDLGSAQ